MSQRILRTEVLTLRHPVAAPTGPAGVSYSHRECLVVRAEDGAGRLGWGETYLGAGLAAVAGELGSMLEGKEPLRARQLLDLLQESGADSMAISAWAIAIDDLRGRQLEVSVSELYGGGVEIRSGRTPRAAAIAMGLIRSKAGWTTCSRRPPMAIPRSSYASAGSPLDASYRFWRTFDQQPMTPSI